MSSMPLFLLFIAFEIVIFKTFIITMKALVSVILIFKLWLLGAWRDQRQLWCRCWISSGSVHHCYGVLPHTHRRADSAVLSGLFIYSFSHPFINIFIHSFIFLILTVDQTALYFQVYSSIHSFILSSLYSFILSFIFLILTRPDQTVLYFQVYSFIHSFIHPFTYIFIHSSSSYSP